MKIVVAPSILSADFGCLADEIRSVEKAGADWIHIDVMDGNFVPNITVGLPVLRAARKATALPLDVHLMIVSPERYLKDFADAGADHLVVQAEACVHLHRTLQVIKDLDKLAGVAFNPATPIDALNHVIDLVDIVLIMSVNPGFGGQKFIASSLPKIRQVKEIIDKSGRSIRLQVDGGIYPFNSKEVMDAGVDTIVAGNAIFGQPDLNAAIEGIRLGKTTIVK